MTEMLHRMAEDFEDIAYDLETGAVDVRHPELLPQTKSEREDRELCGVGMRTTDAIL